MGSGGPESRAKDRLSAALKSAKKGGIISRSKCLLADENTERSREKRVNFRIATYLGIVAAVGAIVCWPGPLQGKQWLLGPQGEQEVKAGKISPERQELDEVRRLLVQGKAGKARETLDKWFKTFPDSALNAEAMYYTGQSLEGLGKLYKAFEKYEELVAEFGDREYFYKALEAQFGIAREYLNGRKRPILGIFRVSGDDVGVKILERIAERWPGSNLAERSLMLLGDYYLKKKQYEAAVFIYKQLIESYPSSVFVREARLEAAKAELGKFKGSAFDPTPLVEAKELLLEYQSLYGPNAQSSEVQPMLARIEELQAHRVYEIGQFYQRTGKKDSARVTFEQVIHRWPNTKWAGKAQSKLKKLVRKSADQSREVSAVAKSVKKE